MERAIMIVFFPRYPLHLSLFPLFFLAKYLKKFLFFLMMYLSTLFALKKGGSFLLFSLPSHTSIATIYIAYTRKTYLWSIYASIASIIWNIIRMHFMCKIILGDKWLAAVPVLKILSVFGIVRAITHPCYSLFLAMKKQELITAATLVNIIVMAITLIPVS